MLNRRVTLLKSILAALSLSLLASAAAAQTYPSKPIKLIAPFPPGGGVDALARIVQPVLQESLGQPVIVENKPGAAGAIGIEACAKAAKDGYTICVASAGATSVAKTLNPKLGYDPLVDLAPLANGVSVANVLVVHPSVKAESVADLIALAKSQPGKLTFGSGGVGTTQHLSGELFKLKAGVDMLHVPYKGTSQVMADILAGQISMTFTDPTALVHVKAGKLRALGQVTQSRSPSIPDIPTIGEAGLPGYSATSWYGFFTAVGTPPDVVARLSKEVIAALNSPGVVEKLKAAGMDPMPMPAEAFAKFLAADVDLWAGVIKAANLKLE